MLWSPYSLDIIKTLWKIPERKSFHFKNVKKTYFVKISDITRKGNTLCKTCSCLVGHSLLGVAMYVAHIERQHPDFLRHDGVI